MKHFTVLGALLLASVPAMADSQFNRLQQVLEQYGFDVRLELPPVPGAYGSLNSRSKTISINPVVFELGIAQPTLVHEAVHAAQSCAGGGNLHVLNLQIGQSPITRPYFLRYHAERRQLESEAYTVQVRSDRVAIAIALLHQHCQ